MLPLNNKLLTTLLRDEEWIVDTGSLLLTSTDIYEAIAISCNYSLAIRPNIASMSRTEILFALLQLFLSEQSYFHN